ncbi:4-alpha-glucanotransferase [Methylophaga sp.]|uniref:4-alpha-glucanotransferase n=1 Tax=Methylophaga sp. TaxID=2024840 RepID=UPI00271DACE7|nr:4-alpha-glucanotransferase [Methylophaga sp.]MDO8825176.1 4-alpha-glucanotransferase [Methylophaga sp.]
MKQAHIFDNRRTGVLLHITSLPSGNLGADAYRFVDFLQQAGVTVWQMLPLGPTHEDGSPYQCLSAHAGNNKLLCIDSIKAKPWCRTDDLAGKKVFTMVVNAYKQFTEHATEADWAAFNDFCQRHAFWLDDYVLYREIRNLNHAMPWYEWPQPLRDRQPAALNDVAEQRAESLTIRRFEQFLFFDQWQNLKTHANQHQIKLFGDMPIFVAHDSADVWAAPELFTLDATGQATKVTGVPPDYFSATGQRWGNPLYAWPEHIKEDFSWWLKRLTTQLDLFDLIRIDHFRGFEACWEIPASCETAMEGEWGKAPGEALFKKLVSEFGELPLVAEDLGIITAEVTALREQFAMPGMKILQFAFGGDADNPYLPHKHCNDSITYTGTHDNNTSLGWYDEIDEATRQHLHQYIGPSDEAMPWLLIREALKSVSQLSVIPMQDLLELGSEHRMNVPGTIDGNWKWQFEWNMLPQGCSENLRQLNQLYGRIIYE